MDFDEGIKQDLRKNIEKIAIDFKCNLKRRVKMKKKKILIIQPTPYDQNRKLVKKKKLGLFSKKK